MGVDLDSNCSTQAPAGSRGSRRVHSRDDARREPRDPAALKRRRRRGLGGSVAEPARATSSIILFHPPGPSSMNSFGARPGARA